MKTKNIAIKISYSNLFAQMSEQIVLAVTPLVAVLTLNASASDTAWLQALQTLPFFIISPFIGIVADRYSTRNLMIYSELIRIGVLGIIFALLFTQILSLSWLVLLGMFGSIGTVIYSVATSAYIPGVIARTELVNVNRWIELARSLSYTAGPALAGILIGYIGALFAYSFAVILSFIALILIILLPKEQQNAVVHEPMLKQLKAGTNFILQHPFLKPILFTALFFNIAWFIIQGVFTAYAILALELSAQKIGIAVSVYGIGMITGALYLRVLWAASYIRTYLWCIWGFYFIIDIVGTLIFFGLHCLFFIRFRPYHLDDFDSFIAPISDSQIINRASVCFNVNDFIWSSPCRFCRCGDNCNVIWC